MAASTITRATWANDTGTPTTPNADGTLINNTRLQSDIYAPIDQLLAGSAPYNPLTFGGGIKTEGFDGSGFAANFDGSRTGGVITRTRNSQAGSANSAEFRLGNDADASAGRLIMCASNFTTSGNTRQDGLTLLCTRAGGLVLACSHASGAVWLYTRIGFGTSTPAAIGANQTDYNLGGVDAHTYFLSTSAAGCRIDGITGGFAGREIEIVYTGPHTLVIGYNTGAAGNKVLMAAAGDLTMAAYSVAKFKHDGTQWFMGAKS